MMVALFYISQSSEVLSCSVIVIRTRAVPLLDVIMRQMLEQLVVSYIMSVRFTVLFDFLLLSKVNLVFQVHQLYLVEVSV